MNHIWGTEDIGRAYIEFEDYGNWYLAVAVNEGKYGNLVRQRNIIETWNADHDHDGNCTTLKTIDKSRME